MSSTSQLLCYFAEQFPGSGRSQLVKFCFLADYQSRRFLGRPISPLSYRWDHYGPFDPKVLEALDRLVDDGLLLAHPLEVVPGRVRAFGYTRSDQPAPLDFTAPETAILDSVVQIYRDAQSKGLLEDVVYETEPMVDARARQAFGQPLNMEQVDNLDRIPGLELEEVWQADAELRAGKGVPLQPSPAKA